MYDLTELVNKIYATPLSVTGNDVPCYDRFVFDQEGKLKKWYPLLSRTFTHSEFYGSAAVLDPESTI